MDDKTILELYLNRDEYALVATSDKYKKYCSKIAANILTDPEDVEECLNDTWLHAWNAIPPHDPPRLSAFLGKITREIAINRYKAKNAQKRGNGEYDIALAELEEVIVTSGNPVEQAIESEMLGQAIGSFLRKQPILYADIFIRRYYHLCPTKQIAIEFKISESKTKSILFRVRKKLRAYLEKEDLL